MQDYDSDTPVHLDEATEESGPRARSETLTGREREILKDAAKLDAGFLGSEVLARAMEERGVSLREVSRRTGIDTARLSELSRSRSKSGPHLWMLVAIADALELDLDIQLSPRD